jgi:hypothetical protein
LFASGLGIKNQDNLDRTEMLTEIVTPQTMPKNNRKIPKGQRFFIGALGIGHWALSKTFL